MECNKCYNFNCGLLGIVLGILAGIATGIVFSFGLIPLPLNLIRVALIISVVALGVFLVTVLAGNLNENGCGIKKCICMLGKYLILGSIGTLLSGTIILIIGLVTTSIASAIFMGLTTFFFVVTIVTLICLCNCLTKKACDIF